MKMTTKLGDSGCTCLPTVDPQGRASKGALVFEVFGAIDQLDHDLMRAAVFLESSMKLPFFKTLAEQLRAKVVQVRLFYATMINGGPKDYQEYVNILEKEGTDLENLYKGIKGEELKADFGLIVKSFAGLAIDQARLSARALERSIVAHSDYQAKMKENDNAFKDELLSHRDVLPYVNRLSDYLYTAMCMVEVVLN